MSSIKDIQHPVIDNLIATSKKTLEWIPYSQINDIESCQTDNFYYAIHKRTCDGRVNDVKITLQLVGSSEERTPASVSTFARIYSLSTQTYNSDDVNQFRRYPGWLDSRNSMIKGFTKYKDNYYMVTDRKFCDCYSRYGFCTACGILRCSPVW